MNTESKVAGIILGGIAVALILIPVLGSTTTIFLTTENGGTPTSCAPANGFVLAQNLTDLCDVTIILPLTNQIIRYNGSQWVNVNDTTISENTVCNNLGLGTILCAGDNVNIKTLVSGSGITLSNDSNTVTITATTTGESTNCNNVGTGKLIHVVGSNCDAKSLKAGTGLTIANDSNSITYSNSGIISASCSNGVSCSGTDPLSINGSGLQNQETTVCNNLNSGTFIIKNSTSGNCNVRSLVSGSGISLSNDSNSITITSTVSGESTVCTNDGHGAGNVCNGGNIHLKGIASGTSISITMNGTDIIVTNSAPENTVCNNSSNPTGEGLCIDNVVTLKKLLAGTGISLSSNGTRITIANTYTCTSAGGTSLIKTSTTGSNCDLKGLTAGVGLTLTSNTNDNNYKTNFVNGTGISITGSTSQTFTNTGVISNSCSKGITCSGTDPSTFTVSWELLCQNSLGGDSSSLSCSSFTGRKFLHIDLFILTSASGTALIPGIQFNSDTGTNYAYRFSLNNAADATAISVSQCQPQGSNNIGNNGGGKLSFDSINISNQRKILWGVMSTDINTSTATAPTKIDFTCKWNNASNQITTVTLNRVSGTSNFATGTEITVWGYD